jgi:4-hydroxy-tetrahydrodipicolinate synthase
MIEGVYTVLITPFHADGSLDKEGLQHLIQRQIQAHVHGIVVLGTTSETPTLTANEKKTILQLSRKWIPTSIQLIAGTGLYSTAASIEETKQAEAFGADAALIVTPYYNKPTQEGLFLHFEAIAKASSLPIIVYNIASRTGQNLQTSTLKRLMHIPSIVGVKEASGSISQIMEVIEAKQEVRPDFTVLSGDDNLTLPLMALGGDGVFSVVSNLIPGLIKELYDLTRSNDWKPARKIHYELLPLFRGAFIETNPIPIKALMHFEGLPSGHCRLPLCALAPENEKKLRHLHETIKLPLLASA